MVDQKISQLNALTTPAGEDLIAIVDDPSGSPETKRITFSNLSKLVVEGTAKTSNYTLTANDKYVPVNASSGDVTISVPAASGNDGLSWFVKKVDSSTNFVIIDPDSSETIDGATTYKLRNENESVAFMSDGTNIVILGNKT